MEHTATDSIHLLIFRSAQKHLRLRTEDDLRRSVKTTPTFKEMIDAGHESQPGRFACVARPKEQLTRLHESEVQELCLESRVGGDHGHWSRVSL